MTDDNKAILAYRTPEQLIAEHRKEHGAEIEADVEEFVTDANPLPLEQLISDALFHLILIEKHLSAEREKIGKETNHDNTE